MLSWLRKLWTKLNRSPPTTMARRDTEVRMGDVDSPSSVWIPSSAMLERPHLDRHQSFRRQLSRKLSFRAKQISSSTCNATACIIAVCFIVATLALIVSCFTFYLYVQRHGLGPELNILQETLKPHSSGRQGGHSSLPPQVFDGVATALPQHPERTDDEGAAKAYAHIVGRDIGPRGNDRDLECLNSWQVNATHNVDFVNHYALEIKEPGFYYVYSQIYFSDSEIGATLDSSLPMRSSTNRNHVPLMESVIPFREYATKYHGGVFHLSKGDRITVSVSNDELRINTGSDKTFFGVFMLGSTPAGHGAAPS